MTGSIGYLRDGLRIRLLEDGDGRALAEAYARNRAHLAPWEPTRDDSFFTSGHQSEIIRAKRTQHTLGAEVPWVLVQENNDGAAMQGSGRTICSTN